MRSFETKNAADGTVLRGHIWAAAKPKAVMNLVHGFGEHSGRYADMAANLNAKGISVVTLDLRGHGQSDGARGYCPDYNLLLEDVDALLTKTRETYPDLPQILYGHSMGGGLVLNHQLNNTLVKSLASSTGPSNTPARSVGLRKKKPPSTWRSA